MQCSASHKNNQDDVRYLEKEGPHGEAVCQVQGLTKPEKTFFLFGGGSFSELSMTQRQCRSSLFQ